VAIAVLGGRAETLASIQDFQFVLPATVVGELRYGALNSRRSRENLALVERLSGRCVILPVTESTADVYARIRVRLREQGKPIPENDLWIAAACIEHELPLAAIDSHFDVVEGLVRQTI
jgi:tRNA(fMet)-specific endonuclease VapC